MGREEGRREGREEGEKKGLRLGVLILCEALTATLCNLEALQQSIKSSRRWLS